MALLPCPCRHISSVPLESLATCILSVSARYIFLLIITSIRFFPITVVLWNRLPADLVLFDDLDSFKREVSKISYLGP